MSKEFYFKYKDAELCYSKEYFIDKMKERGVTEIEVFEGLPFKSKGIFWCSEQCFCGDNSYYTCGKQCDDYKPRNGKSGCCKYYKTSLYQACEEPTILKLDELIKEFKK